jgi:hypothetical protein
LLPALAACPYPSFLPPFPAFAADAGSAAISAWAKSTASPWPASNPAIVSRARNAVTTTAPKTRANGEIFENATNSSLPRTGQGHSKTCPTLATLVNA